MGLAGFDFDILLGYGKQLYENTHPTIPDSVLNYDRNIHLFHADSMPVGGGTPRIIMEPDCAPHPFDITALFALYQNVPRGATQ